MRIIHCFVLRAFVIIRFPDKFQLYTIVNVPVASQQTKTRITVIQHGMIYGVNGSDKNKCFWEGTRINLSKKNVKSRLYLQ